MNIATVASVSYQPPEFIRGPSVLDPPEDEDEDEYQSIPPGMNVEQTPAASAMPATIGDLLGGLDLMTETAAPAAVGVSKTFIQFFKKLGFSRFSPGNSAGSSILGCIFIAVLHYTRFFKTPRLKQLLSNVPIYALDFMRGNEYI